MRIKEHREKTGLTQKQLAQKLNVGLSTVTQWEQGLRNPNGVQRKRLAQFFNISEAELYILPASDLPLIPADIQMALSEPWIIETIRLLHTQRHRFRGIIQALLNVMPTETPTPKKETHP